MAHRLGDNGPPRAGSKGGDGDQEGLAGRVEMGTGGQELGVKVDIGTGHGSGSKGGNGDWEWGLAGRLGVKVQMGIGAGEAGSKGGDGD